MSCPTCSHSLIYICTQAEVLKHYHCERCGTMVAEYNDGHRNVYVPKIVERCRVFSKALGNATGKNLAVSWQTLGIAESIYTPEERGTK